MVVACMPISKIRKIFRGNHYLVCFIKFKTFRKEAGLIVINSKDRNQSN
jgi:hypothetical protein